MKAQHKSAKHTQVLSFKASRRDLNVIQANISGTYPVRVTSVAFKYVILTYLNRLPLIISSHKCSIKWCRQHNEIKHIYTFSLWIFQIVDLDAKRNRNREALNALKNEVSDTSECPLFHAFCHGKNYCISQFCVLA